MQHFSLRVVEDGSTPLLKLGISQFTPPDVSCIIEHQPHIFLSIIAQTMMIITGCDTNALYSGQVNHHPHCCDILSH